MEKLWNHWERNCLILSKKFCCSQKLANMTPIYIDLILNDLLSPASEASREVENFDWRKNTHPSKYGVKVHLYLIINFTMQMLRETCPSCNFLIFVIICSFDICYFGLPYYVLLAVSNFWSCRCFMLKASYVIWMCCAFHNLRISIF